MATVTYKEQEFTVREAYVDELEAIFALALRGEEAEAAPAGAPAPIAPEVPEDAFDAQGLGDRQAHATGRLLVRLSDLLDAQGRGLCAQGQPHRRQCAPLNWQAQRDELRATLGQIPQLAGLLAGGGTNATGGG